MAYTQPTIIAPSPERQQFSRSDSGVDIAAVQSSAPLLWVLVPNSPWRAQVTAQAGRRLTAGSKAPRPKLVREVAGATRPGQGARYMWAALLARIYGVLALQCSRCGGRVHLVGFITEPAPVRQILEHVGERQLHR